MGNSKSHIGRYSGNNPEGKQINNGKVTKGYQFGFEFKSGGYGKIPGYPDEKGDPKTGVDGRFQRIKTVITENDILAENKFRRVQNSDINYPIQKIK